MRKLVVPASVLFAAAGSPRRLRLIAQAPKPRLTTRRSRWPPRAPFRRRRLPRRTMRRSKSPPSRRTSRATTGLASGSRPDGRFRATNVPLRELISAAYGTPQPLAAFQITGGPKWMESDRFDIVAKAPGDPQPGPNGPPAAMFAMLRNLLAERFQLTVHRETKEVAHLRPGARTGRRQAGSAAASGGDRLRGADGGGTRPRCAAAAARRRASDALRHADVSGEPVGGSSSMAQLTNALAQVR